MFTAIWPFGSNGVALAQTQTTIDTSRGEVTLLIPTTYVSEDPLPLVVSLHGFRGSGDHYAQYWLSHDQIEKKRFVVSTPTGTLDSKGRSFWNATDACCNKEGSDVDDVAYILSLIEAIQAQYSIDPNRIHITGYSNGGFMAHRMACEHADKIASIISVAGAGFDDPANCQPSQPVHVLQIHGTDDAIIGYGGGYLQSDTSAEYIRHPSALESVAFWAKNNGCSLTPTSQPGLDITDAIEGAETTVLRYHRQCSRSTIAELWSTHEGTHSPRANTAFHELTVDWLLQHPKNQ